MTGAPPNLILKDRHVLVMGAGKSGLSMSRLGVEEGARVTLTDARTEEALAGVLRALPPGVETSLGGHSFALLETPPDYLLVSPGVDLRQSFVRAARLKAVPVLGEIELAYRFMPALRPIAAVTGSNGKSTVVTMIAECLRQAGRDWFVGGNLGTPYVEGVLEARRGRDWQGYLLEISSFQLEAAQQFHPHVGAVLNVLPNHLDRYEGLDDYGRTKLRLFEGMTRRDYAIVHADDAWTYQHYHRGMENRWVFSTSGPVEEGVHLSGSTAVVSRSGHRYPLEDSPLIGPHNRANWLAAIAVAECLGLPAEAIRAAISSYRALPHRLQPAGERNGVKFINDSKATNVAGVRVALEAVEGPVWLLAGGMAKGDHFGDLSRLLKSKVRKVMLFGRDRELIAGQIAGLVEFERHPALEEALASASAQASPGDTVLLSPGCASFDQYAGYEMRGQAFMDAVRQAGGTGGGQ